MNQLKEPYPQRWNLKSDFPSLESAEYKSFVLQLEYAVQAWVESVKKIPVLTSENAETWAESVERLEEISKDFSHLSSYVHCLGSEDTQSEANKKAAYQIGVLGAEYSKAYTLMNLAIKNASTPDFEKFLLLPKANSIRSFFVRMKEESQYLMDGPREALAADLGVTGFEAWGRLYNQLTGSLKFSIRSKDGSEKTYSMADRRSLLSDSDPEIRRQAFVSSNKSLAEVQDTLAACLNGIAGTRLTLNKYGGVPHYLTSSLFQAKMDQSTVDVMLACVEKYRPLVHSYLIGKAKCLGREKLGYQDLGAPLPLQGSTRLSWEEATDLVLKAFERFYPALAQFSREMLSEGQVESEQRPGKRPGAYCTKSYRTRQSRVFMTFGGAFGDAKTLAHELGHAFHNLTMADMRPFACMSGMSLAETASTFAEAVVDQALIEDPSVNAELRAQILTEKMDNAVVFLLDIPMRYLFERKFYEERAKGEVPATRLCELMLETQKEVFGDSLAEGELDPYFWASKLHFYITGVSFYNFPYTVGHLLSQSLFIQAQKEGSSFLPQYEQFLRLTGTNSVESVVAKSLNADVTKPLFWNAVLGHLETDYREYLKVVPPLFAH
jgi:oligoendopeptidase F